MAALYAYETVLFVGGDFARAELHDSASNYFRIYTNKLVYRPPTERELARLRRHPDKGRSDFSLVLAATLPGAQSPRLSDTAPGTNASACPVSPANLWDPLEAAISSIRFTPRWVFDVEVYSPLPTTTLTVFLFLAALFYSLCSIFLVLN